MRAKDTDARVNDHIEMICHLREGNDLKGLIQMELTSQAGGLH